MQDELMTTGIGEEYEPMLPDGWQEGDDIFADADNWSGDADGQTAVEGATDQTETTEEAAEVPTTDAETENGEAQNAEEAQPEALPTEPTPAPNQRILKLRVNHTEHEVDVNQLSDEALVERLQKAAAFDAMREQQNKQKYRQIVQDQIYAGMTEDAAHMVATHKLGKSYPMEDQAPAPAAAPEASAPTPAAPARDLRAEVAQVQALYPDFKGVPAELVNEIVTGKPVLTAYVEYRERQNAQAAASLKKENAVLKQNAAAAARAPVKGVTGTGSPGTKATDPFLAGFNADY